MQSGSVADAAAREFVRAPGARGGGSRHDTKQLAFAGGRARCCRIGGDRAVGRGGRQAPCDVRLVARPPDRGRVRGRPAGPAGLSGVAQRRAAARRLRARLPVRRCSGARRRPRGTPRPAPPARRRLAAGVGRVQDDPQPLQRADDRPARTGRAAARAAAGVPRLRRRRRLPLRAAAPAGDRSLRHNRGGHRVQLRRRLPGVVDPRPVRPRQRRRGALPPDGRERDGRRRDAGHRRCGRRRLRDPARGGPHRLRGDERGAGGWLVAALGPGRAARRRQGARLRAPCVALADAGHRRHPGRADRVHARS